MCAKRLVSLAEELQWMEFYAGEGRLTKVMKAAMQRAVRFDILDNVQGQRKRNFMDLTHTSGYAPLGVKVQGLANRDTGRTNNALVGPCSVSLQACHHVHPAGL